MMCTFVQRHHSVLFFRRSIPIFLFLSVFGPRWFFVVATIADRIRWDTPPSAKNGIVFFVRLASQLSHHRMITQVTLLRMISRSSEVISRVKIRTCVLLDQILNYLQVLRNKVVVLRSTYGVQNIIAPLRFLKKKTLLAWTIVKTRVLTEAILRDDQTETYVFS